MSGIIIKLSYRLGFLYLHNKDKISDWLCEPHFGAVYPEISRMIDLQRVQDRCLNTIGNVTRVYISSAITDSSPYIYNLRPVSNVKLYMYDIEFGTCEVWRLKRILDLK